MTVADKAFLIGDDAAHAIVAYAAALARHRSADQVTVQAIGPDGHKVEAVLLLNEGTPLVIEGTDTELPTPENAEEVARIVAATERLEHPPEAHSAEFDDEGVDQGFEDS